MVILAIGTVLRAVGLVTFEPTNAISEILFGLRTIVFIFLVLVLIIPVLAIYKYLLDEKRLLQAKDNQKMGREEKKGKMEIQVN